MLQNRFYPEASGPGGFSSGGPSMDPKLWEDRTQSPSNEAPLMIYVSVSLFRPPNIYGLMNEGWKNERKVFILKFLCG